MLEAMNLTRCGHCGANLAPADLSQQACRYCGTVLPHHARAAQQAELVTNLLADKNGNGIPDAFEGLVAGSTASASQVVTYQASFVNGQHVMTSQSLGGGPVPGFETAHPGPNFGIPHQAIHAQLQLQQVMNSARRGVAVAVAVGVIVALGVACAALALVVM
jgi:hypothetical protein